MNEPGSELPQTLTIFGMTSDISHWSNQKGERKMNEVQLKFKFDTHNQLSLFIDLMDVFEVKLTHKMTDTKTITVPIENSTKLCLDQIYDIAQVIEERE